MTEILELRLDVAPGARDAFEAATRRYGEQASGPFDAAMLPDGTYVVLLSVHARDDDAHSAWRLAIAPNLDGPIREHVRKV